MDSSAMSWLSQMELDDSVFTDQFDLVDSFDEDVVAVIRQDFESCLSVEQDYLLGSPEEPPPLGGRVHQKPNNLSDFQAFMSPPDNRACSSNAPIILNFGNAHSPENSPHVNSRAMGPGGKDRVAREEQCSGRGKKTKRVRPASQTYDHIVAERKRREQLSQRFVVLSTMVPGLKKMDKTSVLGDAINYLKHLQERVKTLEEQVTKQPVESVVLVRKSQIVMEDEGSSDEKCGSSDELTLPEIEAKVCNNRLQIKVQCEKQKGVLTKLLSKIEKLNLVVVNTNVVTFAGFVLDISVIAKMEKEFNMTATEVVKRIRTSLQSSN